MTGFGLRGVWSPDCYKAITPDNPRISINFSYLGVANIEKRGKAKTDFSFLETMRIIDATVIQPDMLLLKLGGISWKDQPLVQDRIDTYQRLGARMRLFRSEVTSGPKLGLVVDEGLIRNGTYYDLPSPILEQCQD